MSRRLIKDKGMGALSPEGILIGKWLILSENIEICGRGKRR